MPMKRKFPYEACKLCVTIDDCPAPEAAWDGMRTPTPPHNCPRPMEIIENTLKAKKKKSLW